jgi:hypothetical protein
MLEIASVACWLADGSPMNHYEREAVAATRICSAAL